MFAEHQKDVSRLFRQGSRTSTCIGSGTEEAEVGTVGIDGEGTDVGDGSGSAVESGASVTGTPLCPGGTYVNLAWE